MSPYTKRIGAAAWGFQDIVRSLLRKNPVKMLDLADRLNYRIKVWHRWRIHVEAVTISPKYQVVIPRKIRESLKLAPGQKVQVIEYGNRIELIPERKISEMRGFLRGMNAEIGREQDRV